MLAINEIHEGDCLELMKEIPEGSVDMVLCDLPYGTTACKWDTIIPFELLWKEYRCIAKTNAAIVLTASQPFTSALVMSNIGEFKYCWIWDKRMTTNFAMAKKQPLRNYEDIVVFYKHQCLYNPQIDNKNTLKPFGKIRGGPSDVCGNLGDKKNVGVGYPKSILTFPRPNNLNSDGNLHPTQKPVALFEYLIRTYTNEGDLVLDNCSGSGTTAIACINTKRNYICIEKESKYVALSRKRIADHLAKMSEQLL